MRSWIRKARTQAADEGLGLIEIVVAMLLLGVLAVAFLPVLIQGLQLAAKNATRATAVQLAQEQMEVARGQGDDCTDIQDLAAATLTPVTDPRNVTLAIARETGDCPSSYPSTMSFHVIVINETTGEELANAETLIFVATE